MRNEELGIWGSEKPNWSYKPGVRKNKLIIGNLEIRKFEE